MTDMEVWESFRPIAANILGLTPDEVDLDMALAETLGADSCDLIELESELARLTGRERSYQQPTQEMKTFTVRDLLLAWGINDPERG